MHLHEKLFGIGCVLFIFPFVGVVIVPILGWLFGVLTTKKGKEKFVFKFNAMRVVIYTHWAGALIIGGVVVGNVIGALMMGGFWIIMSYLVFFEDFMRTKKYTKVFDAARPSMKVSTSLGNAFFESQTLPEPPNQPGAYAPGQDLGYFGIDDAFNIGDPVPAYSAGLPTRVGCVNCGVPNWPGAHTCLHCGNPTRLKIAKSSQEQR